MKKHPLAQTISSLTVNITNLFLFALSATTGLMIQLNYHAGRMPDNQTVIGLDRYGWHTIHLILSAIALTGLTYHLISNKKAVAYIFFKNKKKTSSRLRISGILTLLLIVTGSTGIFSYFFCLSGNNEIRHEIVEIHDKLGIVISIFFIIHFTQHFRSLFKTFYGKIIRLKINESENITGK